MHTNLLKCILSLYANNPIKKTNSVGKKKKMFTFILSRKRFLMQYGTYCRNINRNLSF